MKLTDSIKKGLSSSTGQALTGSALDLYDGWMSGDADKAGGSSKSSITDEPWFLPVCAVAVLGVLYLATKKK